jgi:predicted ATP-grasp superfamily ATP-dependent carboligase
MTMNVPRDTGAPAGRVILTYARGWQTLVATRSLGQRGVEVITGDEYAMSPSSFSKYSMASFRYSNVTRSPEQFLDELEEIVIKYKPEDPSIPYVLMPIHKESYLIARNRARFEPHIRVPLPEIEHIEQVHNKGILAADARERGIPAPTTWLPETVEAFNSMVEEITLPAFVKLRESAAGVGVQKVDSPEELKGTFDEFIHHFRLTEGDYPIIQTAVPGDDYCVTTLFDHGKLVAAMTYRNLRAFPPEKGAGVMRETVKAPRMEAVAADLLGPMNWHGVAEIDFRWDGRAETEPKLIEVNPRFWGGLIQAVESGWDYPWLLFRLAADGHVSLEEEGRYDVRTETPMLALLATLQEMADNKGSMDKLSAAWDTAKGEFREGSKRAGLRQLFHGLKESLDMKDRLREVKRQLKEHENNIYDVLSSNDPLPAFAVFFPLAVFLRHGKVNMELLTGESGPSPPEEK